MAGCPVEQPAGDTSWLAKARRNTSCRGELHRVRASAMAQRTVQAASTNLRRTTHPCSVQAMSRGATTTMYPAPPLRRCRRRSGGRRGCCGHRVVQQTAAHAMRHAHMAQATICERPPRGGQSLSDACTAAFQRMMKGVRAQRRTRTRPSGMLNPRGSQLGGSKGRSKIHV